MKRLGLTMRVDEARERRDALDQAWYALLLGLGYEPVVLPNLPDPSLVARAVQSLDLAGVVLTGGNDLAHLPNATGSAPERDACERALIDACAEHGRAVLGVCRGAQHMIAHYGGTLRPVSGHVATPHGISVQEPAPMPVTDRTLVNSFHNWGATAADLPAPLRPVATAPDSTVEAFVHVDRPQWGIFWHPERDPRDARDGVIIRALFG